MGIAPGATRRGALFPERESVIVSSSYRTDIPAFYGRWFARRLEAGYCRVANPYGGAASTVRLDREAVDGFVFWTRNLGPFRPVLDTVAARGTPFVVQYTITGYPRSLEAAVTAPEKAIGHIRDLARDFGPGRAVWRYDPVIDTDPTPLPWHEENFARLAAALEGAVDEAVVSFAHIYKKTKANTDAAARRHGFAWRDPDESAKRATIAALARIAARHGMALRVCAQPGLLAGLPAGAAAAARCVDAARLSAIGGRIIAAREKGNRPGCACAESRDIGAYDSCPHGCVYCYAVRHRERAREAHRAHDPAGEFLLRSDSAPRAGIAPQSELLAAAG
jgi:hypothetical protein